ncbi:uncharacterized protein TNCV_4040491 [Trichonephila clavipes]|nr:uncharacterized protein TNCV_4040491 [Trichonephila clavipes]
MKSKTFNPELRRKGLHGGTQNPNESVSNVIWFRVPKKIFVQIEVLSLGTYDAISSFNLGDVSKPEILRKLNIEPDDYTVQGFTIKLCFAWPPRSSDLAPCDFYLWEFIKNCVYAPPLPADLPDLRHMIAAAVARITSDTLNKVWDEHVYQLDVCRETNGAHIEHL